MVSQVVANMCVYIDEMVALQFFTEFYTILLQDGREADPSAERKTREKGS